MQKFDLYINGTLIGDDLAEAQLPANTSINAATFIGISSTANVANIFTDDVKVYNAVPANIGPVITGAAAATAYTTTYGTASAAQSFPITASNLTANIVATAPSGFEVSTNIGTTYASTATFLQNAGAVNGTLYVRLAAAASVSGGYNSQNIILSSTNAANVNITTAASGNSVTAKTLTVTANATNRVYGAANPAFTASYSGFVNSETAAVLIGSPSLSTTATSGSNAGSYIITATIGTLSATNYAFSFVNGTLNVTKAMPTFNLSSSVNPSGYKSSVTFTANSFAPDVTGSVQFFTNGMNLGGAAAISSASSSAAAAGLPRGATNVITAIYSGDVNYFSLTNSLTQTVTNHLPIGVNLFAARSTNSTTWKIAVTDLLTNVTDVDADTISLTSLSGSTNGATPFISSGYVFYSNTNLVADQFTYSVSDGFGGTASALVNLGINAGVSAKGQAQSIAISGGTATLQFAGIPGFTYLVKRSTNLIDWVTILTTNPVVGVFKHVDDFGDLGGNVPTSAYYRLDWNP